MSSSGTTLIDLLQLRAAQSGSTTYSTLDAAGEITQVRTYERLERRARAIAAHLQVRNLAGKPVILLYAGGVEFLDALWASFLAGVIAVPVMVPPGRARAHALKNVVDESGAAAVLSTTEIEASRKPWLESLGDQPKPWIATDALDESAADAWVRPDVEPSTLAYLQYTSGSTNLPKGVAITHRNALANVEYIRGAYGADRDSVTVSWLPHFHDMGLINGFLGPLGIGCSAYLLLPTTFVQSPIRWLQAITRYGGTHSGAPNFAYQLCVSRTHSDDRETLDLTSWRAAYNGAEPVLSETLSEFTRVFSDFGFRPHTHRPSYGLAEATLLVTASDENGPKTVIVDRHALQRGRVQVRPQANENTRSFVSCGRPPQGSSVRIVDPENDMPRRPGTVGEIWVSSDSTSAGYWRHDQGSERKFRATLPDDDRLYVRTGDLGFLLDDELYVTGRLDDVIIVRGRNHYPQDIESSVARCHPALADAAGAAFAIGSGSEAQLVVAQELSRAHWRHCAFDEVILAVRNAISEEHDLSASSVVLLRPASLPKTTSGKVQRSRCRAFFESGELEVLARDDASQRAQPSGEKLPLERLQALDTDSVHGWVVRWLNHHPELDVAAIIAGANFGEAGLDSLHAMELTGALSELTGAPVAERLPFEFPTLEAFVAKVVALARGQLAEFFPDRPLDTGDGVG